MTLLSLPNRAHRMATLPKVEVVDLRRYGPGPSGDRLLSLPLHRALEGVLGRREQAILFLNRRGFAPSLVCDGCGAIAECPNCSVALTLHLAHGERLRCHYCDYSTTRARCSKCGKETLSQEGSGTERIETLLRESFPEARVGRLDRDVAAGLKSQAVLDRMRARELDILVGTQMVTKGHDLPAVTLVGVLNADAALSMPDYQAAERTFQLLVQVAGRAGRSESPGTVYIQTRNPEHPAVAAAARHDVARFVEAELGARRELGYPPYSRIALVRIDSPDVRAARSTAQSLAALARKAAPSGTEILGPAEAPIARIRGRFRFRFLVRSPTRAGVRAVLFALADARGNWRSRVTLDVDPVSML
jgi:primosomal protein N' (replication factor Y)